MENDLLLLSRPVYQRRSAGAPGIDGYIRLLIVCIYRLLVERHLLVNRRCTKNTVVFGPSIGSHRGSLSPITIPCECHVTDVGLIGNHYRSNEKPRNKYATTLVYTRVQFNPI
jgi:hypothetical protein